MSQIMNAYPTGLERLPENRLRIAWSDGVARIYEVRELRSKCPCATCRETHGPAPEKPKPLFVILKPEEARPLTLDGMQPVGNYAYALAFSDGHDTGIFTFELLRELGQVEH